MKNTIHSPHIQTPALSKSSTQGIHTTLDITDLTFLLNTIHHGVEQDFLQDKKPNLTQIQAYLDKLNSHFRNFKSPQHLAQDLSNPQSALERDFVNAFEKTFHLLRLITSNLNDDIKNIIKTVERKMIKFFNLQNLGLVISEKIRLDMQLSNTTLSRGTKELWKSLEMQHAKITRPEFSEKKAIDSDLRNHNVSTKFVPSMKRIEGGGVITTITDNIAAQEKYGLKPPNTTKYFHKETFIRLLSFQWRLTKLMLYFDQIGTFLRQNVAKENDDLLQQHDLLLLEKHLWLVFTLFESTFGNNRIQYLHLTNRILLDQFSIAFQKIFYLLWYSGITRYATLLPPEIDQKFRNLEEQIFRFLNIDESEKNVLTDLRGKIQHVISSPLNNRTQISRTLHSYLHLVSQPLLINRSERVRRFTLALHKNELDQILSAIGNVRDTSNRNVFDQLYHPFNLEDHLDVFTLLVGKKSFQEPNAEHALKNYSLNTVRYTDSNGAIRRKIFIASSAIAANSVMTLFDEIAQRLSNEHVEYEVVMNAYSQTDIFRFASLFYSLVEYYQNIQAINSLIDNLTNFFFRFSEKLCSEKTILIKFFQFVVEQKNKNVKFESTVNFSLSAFNIRELVAEYRSSKPFASDEDIVADINKKYLAISQGTGLSELDKLIVVEGEKLSLSKQSLGEFVKNTYENGFSYPEDTYIIVIRRVCDTCDHLKNASLTLINALENYSQSNSRAVEIDDSDNLLTGYSDYIDTLHVCEPFLETNEEIDTHASSSSACRFGGTLHVS